MDAVTIIALTLAGCFGLCAFAALVGFGLALYLDRNLPTERIDGLTRRVDRLEDIHSVSLQMNADGICWHCRHTEDACKCARFPPLVIDCTDKSLCGCGERDCDREEELRRIVNE